MIKDFYYSILNFFESLFNFWKFRKVVWNYRWWDYDFLLDFIEFILEDWTKHYGKDSNHVGDKFTRKRICVILKKLRKFRESDCLLNEDYKELKENFFKVFGKNIDKFWD
jgi:hypothetical protein